MKSIYQIALLCLLCANSCKEEESKPPILEIPSLEPVEGPRIAWDFSTRRQLSPTGAGYAGYARMIPLTDGNIYAVYENDGHIHGILSEDNGVSWSDYTVIALPESGVGCAVPEILQLHDGTLMASYNMRPGSNASPDSRFSIRVKTSIDQGLTWSDHVEIYQAGREFENGCWEPAQIQLPSGEIQLYIANEGPYTSSHEQEITMFRSFDHGLTWTDGEQISFRSGHRDGMPVPLILQNGEIIMSIEDNGISGTEFKPMIVKSSDADWSNAPVKGNSVDRFNPMDDNHQIPGSKYAGAPYIDQLISGELIMSYQSDEMRSLNQWDRSDMIVAIGNEDGLGFNRKSRPFYFTDTNKSCMWNSISVIDENTVVALGSTNAYTSGTSVWMIKGYVIPSKVIASKANGGIQIDGTTDENEWDESTSIYIGGYGKTNALLKAVWNDEYIYLSAQVEDENVRSNDGVTWYLDPTNKSTTQPDIGLYSIHAFQNGDVIVSEGLNGQWIDNQDVSLEANVKKNDDGYVIELAVGWNELSAEPLLNSRIGLHAVLVESSGYSEPIAGNITSKPFTWSHLSLQE